MSNIIPIIYLHTAPADAGGRAAELIRYAGSNN